MSCKIQGEGMRSILPTKLVAMATSFEGSKNNFRSFIYGQSFTNSTNVVQISLVDVEIIDPTEITKKALLACTLCRGGGLIITQNNNFVV